MKKNRLVTIIAIPAFLVFVGAFFVWNYFYSRSTFDGSWVFRSEGNTLYGNPYYLDFAQCAVLLEWSGPEKSELPKGKIGKLVPGKGYGWTLDTPGERTVFFAHSDEGCMLEKANATRWGSGYRGYQIDVSTLGSLSKEGRLWLTGGLAGCSAGTSPCGFDGKFMVTDGKTIVPTGCDYKLTNDPNESNHCQ